MGLLGDFSAYIDNLKKRGLLTAKEAASDPGGLLARNIAALSESMPAQEESVMPGAGGGGLLNRPTFGNWGMNAALMGPVVARSAGLRPGVDMKYVLVGDTYPVKDKIKAAGGRYEPDLGWYFKTEEAANEADKLLPPAWMHKFDSNYQDARLGPMAHKLGGKPVTADRDLRTWWFKDEDAYKKLLELVDEFNKAHPSP